MTTPDHRRLTPAQKHFETQHVPMTGQGTQTQRQLHQIRQVARLGWGIGHEGQAEWAQRNYVAAGGRPETWQAAAEAVGKMINELEQFEEVSTIAKDPT